MSTKNYVHWKQGKHNLSNFPSEHHSTKHHISVRPNYVLDTTPKGIKNLFKLPKLPITLQGWVQNYLPPTVEQLLGYKYPMPPVSFASVLNQQSHIKWQPLYLSKNRPSKPVRLNQHLNSKIVRSETNKYGIRLNSNF